MEKTFVKKDQSEFHFLLSAGTPTLIIGIADVGGKPTAYKRKLAFSRLISSCLPHILFLQQFLWPFYYSYLPPGPDEVEIPGQYYYVGNKEAGILFDRYVVGFLLYNESWIKKLLKKMKEMEILPIEYKLRIERMCMVYIQCKVFPFKRFICVSWHGPYNGMKKTDRIKELANLLIFLSNIGCQQKLPIIIGGNFNISITEASKILPNDLIIYEYEPLRRKQGEYKDFYIGSKELPLSNMTAVGWENRNDALDILNHDPVFAKLPTYVHKPYVYSSSYRLY